jgi:hypothetical protein
MIETDGLWGGLGYGLQATLDTLLDTIRTWLLFVALCSDVNDRIGPRAWHTFTLILLSLHRLQPCCAALELGTLKRIWNLTSARFIVRSACSRWHSCLLPKLPRPPLSQEIKPKFAHPVTVVENQDIRSSTVAGDRYSQYVSMARTVAARQNDCGRRPPVITSHHDQPTTFHATYWSW